ncbi:MAG: glycosyltransferase family 4 protein [Gammaproteobacteria bacterium]|nr:glycosyltransferase family 4 protein [Gammaproteobacteria bacterium]
MHINSRSKTHLLIIGYVWPEPNSSAAGSRMLQLIKLFQQQGWHITFASAASQTEHKTDLTALSVAEQNIQLNNSSFDHYIKQLQPQIVLFDRFVTEEQYGWRVAEQCPEALRIIDSEDLHSLREVRQTQLKAQLKIEKTTQQDHQVKTANPQLLFLQMSAREQCQREIAAFYRSDLTLLISEFEQKLLTEHFSLPAQLLHHTPFLLPPLKNKAELPPYAQRQHFIHIGNFRHPPNWDAVLWLKEQIWPLIRQQLPQAELHIYGAYPPPKATALHNIKQGFHVLGWAKDAHQVMQQARVCLAPLRFGAGQKGKLIDAMQCGTPSVTSSIGTEAMAAGLPWGGIIANNPMEIAKAAVKLYKNEACWQQSQKKGFAILHAGYNTQQHGEALMICINALRKNLSEHRQKNFIGRLLNQQTLKSHYYMAKWIEEKNRASNKP